MATETRFSELKDSGTLHSPAPPSHTTSRNEDEISLLDLAITLAQRKKTILWMTAAFAVLSIVISLILPKSYTATVVLMPPQQNSSMSSILASQLGNLGSMAALAGGSGLGLKNPNDMYVAMLKSRTVEDGMIDDYHLMDEYHARYISVARKALEGHVTIDGAGKDGLIHIAFEDRDPDRAAMLANAYVAHFQKLTQSLAITEASKRRLFFENQLREAKDNLANAEESLKQTEQTTGLIQLDSQARALIESAAALRAQIAAKEVQIQAMRTYATGENAQMVQAQQELDSMRTQLAQLAGNEDTSQSLLVPKGKVPQAGLEYVRKLRDVKYYETIFEILARQFEIAKLDEAKEGAVIQIVDPAVKPDRKSFPKRSIIVLAGTVAGFFLGILLAFVQAGLARLREDPESSAKLDLLRQTFRGRTPRLS